MVSPGAMRSGPASARAVVAATRRRLRTIPSPSPLMSRANRRLASVFELKQHPILRDIAQVTLSIRLPVSDHESGLERTRKLTTERRLHRVVLLVANARSLVVELPAEGIDSRAHARPQLLFDAGMADSLRVVEARNVRCQHASHAGVPAPAAFEVAFEL